MSDFSDNLRIPFLDQNVAQPEIPENTAKSVIDSIFSNTYKLETVDDLDITITQTDTSTQATPWQSFVIEILDTNVFLTTGITVFLPDNQRPYILKNSTLKTITFTTLNGTGFSLSSSSNAYAYSDGVNLEKLEFAASGVGTTLESLNDTPSGYGSDGQVLTTDGFGSFNFSDITSYFINLLDVFPNSYAGYGGYAVVVVDTEDGLGFGLAGTNLTGQNEITDDAADFGSIYTGDALVDFTSGDFSGTGLSFGTQGLVGINTDIEFFRVDPDVDQTQLLGEKTVVTHADQTTTSLNNPEYMAQNAQRTADLALKNTLDINAAIVTLSKAASITLTAVGSETGSGEYTFSITP